MRTYAGWAVLLLVSAGCSRSFGPGATGNQPNGTRCTGGGSCSSGICQDGVCCQAVCSEDQTCAAPHNEGSCSPRPPGDACDGGAQCPNGWCFDGVCCATDCSTPCHSCSLPGEPGLCQLAPDNTDPRDECPGICSECFGGTCGPADPGTDPRHDCPEGLVCGIDQTCHTLNGSACSNDAECGEGRCVLGVCLGVTSTLLTQVDTTQVVSAGILGIAATEEGDEAVAVVQNGAADGVGDPSFSHEYLYAHRAGAPWAVTDLPDDTTGASDRTPVRAQPVYLGRSLYLAMFVPAEDCNAGWSTCGVSVIPVTAAGALGGPIFLDANASQVDTLWASASPSGDLSVWYSDQTTFHRAFRSAVSHDWTSTDVPEPADYIAGTMAPGRLHGTDVVAFLRGSGDLGLLDVQGNALGTITPGAGLPTNNCDTAGLYAARGYVEDGPMRLTYDCWDQSYVISIDGTAGSLAPTFTPLHDGYNPAVGFDTLGVAVDGAAPRAAFVKFGQPDTTIQLADISDTATYTLATARSNSSSLYPVESTDAAPTGLGLSMAYTVTNSTDTQEVGGEQIFVVRVAP